MPWVLSHGEIEMMMMMKRQETIRIPFVFELFFSNWNGHSEKDIERIGLFLTYSGLLLMGSLGWALICLALGMNETSMIPLAFTVLTLLNLAIFQTRWSSEWCFSFQVFISITMPFIFQIMLGGVFNGGMVMIWSSVSLMAGVVFLTNRIRRVFLALFILEALLLGVNEYMIMDRFGLYMTHVVFILVNYVAVTIALFFVAEKFISSQMALKHKDYVSNEKIKTLEDSADSQLMGVKSFKRRVLPTTLNFQTSFTDHFISVLEKNVVGTPFYWLGNYYGNDILVVIDGRWEGIYGTMISMECRNTLNTIVYQTGEHDASRILSALSELFLKTCPKTEETEAEIALTVLTYDCTSNELSAAGQGMEVFVKDGSRSGTMTELCSMGVTLDDTYYLKQSMYHSTILGETAQVVVHSQSYSKLINEAGTTLTFRQLLKQWASSDPDPKMNVLRLELEREARASLKNKDLEQDVIAIGLRLSMWD